ncbi:MAG: hypothetical protein WAV98_03495, partial [Minisyncoccia bacterium]
MTIDKPLILFKLAVAIVFAAMALLGGCVTSEAIIATKQDGQVISELEQTGRYADLIKVVQGRLARGQRANMDLLGPLCIAYGQLKQYANLFDCLDKIEVLIRQGDTKINPDLAAKSALQYFTPSDAKPLPGTLRAEAFMELGQYEKAIAAATAAMATTDPGMGGVADLWPPFKYRLFNLVTLSISAVHSGDRELALRYIKELEDVSLPIFIARRYWTPLKRNSLARAYMAIGDYKKALGNLDEGSTKSIYSLNDEMNSISAGESMGNSREIPRLLMLSKALAETGKRAEAKTTLDGLLSFRRLNDFGEIHWLTLFERGRIAENENQRAQAADFYRKAVDIIERQRSTINTEASKIGFVGDKQAVYQRLITVLFADGQYAIAFEYIERAKARALVDMLASKQDFAVHATNASEVRTLLAQANTAEIKGRAQDASLETTRHRNLAIQTNQQLQQQAPELASLVSVTPVTVQDIQGRLPANEVLVEYYASGKELYAFVLSKSGLQ